MDDQPALIPTGDATALINQTADKLIQTLYNPALLSFFDGDFKEVVREVIRAHTRLDDFAQLIDMIQGYDHALLDNPPAQYRDAVKRIQMALGARQAASA